MKITRTKKRTLKAVKPFKNLDEEIKSWEKNSMVDDIGKNRKIGFYKANMTEILNVRFDDKDMKKLRRKADKIGIGPTTLARIWLKERLAA